MKDIDELTDEEIGLMLDRIIDFNLSQEKAMKERARSKDVNTVSADNIHSMLGVKPQVIRKRGTREN